MTTQQVFCYTCQYLVFTFTDVFSIFLSALPFYTCTFVASANVCMLLIVAYFSAFLNLYTSASMLFDATLRSSEMDFH